MRIAIYTLTILLLIRPAIVHAQTPQEIRQVQQEILNTRKQIADLEKEIVKAKKEDPESVPDKESQLASLKQSLSMMEAAARMVGIKPPSINTDNIKSESGFPERKTALLNALPKKTLTRTELISFLTTLHNDLKKKYSPVIVDSAKAVFAKYGDDFSKIALTGVVAWYKTAPSESALILTYAASKSPTDNILNNCGAVLNLISMEEKAIPILKYALPRNEKNCTLLNNI
ncbi:MAG TPA: hypothetical protein VLJ68_00190, partial [Chitinophagaceae bacterium]|nr:hypothetical protein [Chitinophagaceae bacterium]